MVMGMDMGMGLSQGRDQTAALNPILIRPLNQKLVHMLIQPMNELRIPNSMQRPRLLRSNRCNR